MTAAIEARGLSAGFGGVAAIHHVDLEVAPGETVALLGPNGAGKTTTLSALAGIIQPLAGETLLNGEACRLPLHRRARNGLSLLSEGRGILHQLSARDNLRIAQVSESSAIELIPALARFLRVKAGLLSGGEQQMVAVARALGRKPSVLLVDELSLGLAPIVVDRLLGILKEAADSGTAILLVEQHTEKALRIADRAYVMQRGRIVLAGSADDLRGRMDEVRATYLSEGALTHHGSDIPSLDGKGEATGVANTPEAG